jgi:RimJ/RimL family protein N-acetyltransferase
VTADPRRSAGALPVATALVRTVTADTLAAPAVAYVVSMDMVRLQDGTELGIRPIQPDDGARLQAAYLRLSPETQYRRFLAAKPKLSAADAGYLTSVDGQDHYALVAAPADDPDSIVAVARFVRLGEGSRSAEFAVVVGDQLHGQGLGTELLARLADAARIRGVDRFRATMLTDNVAVQRLLWRLSRGKMCIEEQGSISEVEIQLPRRARDGRARAIIAACHGASRSGSARGSSGAALNASRRPWRRLTRARASWSARRRGTRSM